MRPFVLWLKAKRQQDIERTSWRVYVAQSLQALMGGEGASWWETIHPKPMEARTGDEVALSVLSKAGLSVGNPQEGVNNTWT